MMTRLSSTSRRSGAAQLRQTFFFGLLMLVSFELFYNWKSVIKGEVGESYIFSYNYTNYIIIENGAPDLVVKESDNIVKDDIVVKESDDKDDNTPLIESGAPDLVVKESDKDDIVVKDDNTPQDDDEKEHVRELEEDKEPEVERAVQELDDEEVVRAVEATPARATNSTTTRTTTTNLKKHVQELDEKEPEIEREVEATTSVATTSSTPTTPTTDLKEMQKKFYRRQYDALEHLHSNPKDLLYWFSGNPRKFRDYFNGFPHYEFSFDDKKWGANATNIYTKGTNLKAEYKIDFKPQKTFTGVDEVFDIPNSGDSQAIPFLHFEDKISLCRAAQFFEQYRLRQQNSNEPYKPWPHVAIVGLHRDFGAVSEYIEGVTYQSNHRRKDWKKRGCSEDYVLNYINHPETLAVVTCQFHIWDHPKVHSIPIGIKGPGGTQKALTKLKQRVDQAETEEAATTALADRNQLVMVNFKLWKFFDSRHRAMRILESDQMNWPNGTHFNTSNHYHKKPTPEQMAAYSDELVGSKFVLSPTGWGIDCYRNYEALIVGNIPVLETMNRTDGWVRTFDDLPVAWIHSFEHLSPQWLEDKYVELLQKWDTYKWEKLTRHWWLEWTVGLGQPALDGSWQNAVVVEQEK